MRSGWLGRERPADRAVAAACPETGLFGGASLSSPRSLSERHRVILLCADGLASKDVAAELCLDGHPVGIADFSKDRCDALLDEARLGRPRTIDHGDNVPNLSHFRD